MSEGRNLCPLSQGIPSGCLRVLLTQQLAFPRAQDLESGQAGCRGLFHDPTYNAITSTCFMKISSLSPAHALTLEKRSAKSLWTFKHQHSSPSGYRLFVFLPYVSALTISKRAQESFHHSASLSSTTFSPKSGAYETPRYNSTQLLIYDSNRMAWDRTHSTCNSGTDTL